MTFISKGQAAKNQLPPKLGHSSRRQSRGSLLPILNELLQLNGDNRHCLQSKGSAGDARRDHFCWTGVGRRWDAGSFFDPESAWCGEDKSQLPFRDALASCSAITRRMGTPLPKMPQLPHVVQGFCLPTRSPSGWHHPSGMPPPKAVGGVGYPQVRDEERPPGTSLLLF